MRCAEHPQHGESAALRQGLSPPMAVDTGVVWRAPWMVSFWFANHNNSGRLQIAPRFAPPPEKHGRNAQSCTRCPQHQITTMSVERRVATDRRTGKDRRQTEAGPPTNFERRRNVEARQPELTELHLSEDELKALGFAPEKSTPKK